MALSVFDLFSVGIGPSSSHTVGPMRAANMFLEELGSDLEKVGNIRCTLHGSLGSTGKGHATDVAVMLGLLGEVPETVNPRSVMPTIAEVERSHELLLAGRVPITFAPASDIIFDGGTELPAHPNGMILEAFDANGESLRHCTYYSVGGGFVVSGDVSPSEPIVPDETAIPYPYETAADLLAICQRTGLSIAKVAMENEKVWRSESEVRQGLLHIWDVMNECIRNGSETEGMLPGSLRVLRRAPGLYQKLTSEGASNDPLRGMDWITFYALAVNEENAAGGRVVTAPTNGAAGIIPAVLRYYLDFVPGACDDAVVRFLLTAGAIGIIFKNTASISGAEVGCQGEVGSACSMAAGAMAAVLGGSPEQVENAAEIGMEHNLGLTCDPVGGLVQVPCIERNAIASVKAIAAARTALRGNGKHIVSLDSVIKTMRETGLDMQSKYKETSLGGLAVNVIEC
ncbi:L-serine ammonia-lyase [Arcanobacterium bovis]|uniref:L-serine dehydratase n=1 Tax=Arcanobacterium bovis TaxID=2529275 RepID=A0A4Q9V1B2_9ACTO|nr:L-serine ammonia-lyase [Arcanobacterium bovis]TBW22871.1 L-serine ammonia-lyase [Arcanobacterium bovis]